MSANPDDKNLIERSLKGDTRAFALLVSKYQKVVFNVLLGLTKSSELALDLSQETFIKAYRYLPTFDKDQPFRPWILTISTNTWKNHLRVRSNQIVYEDIYEVEDRLFVEDNSGQEAELELKLAGEWLTRSLGQINPKHRQIFLLRYQYDLPYEEIASICDEPLSSVKSILFRTREKLRRMRFEEVSLGEH